MRLFLIHNRAYKLRYVVAEDIQEALTLAAQAGHIKRPTQYRKWSDVTDSPPIELQSQIQALLAQGRAGLIEQTAEGWRIIASVFAMALVSVGTLVPKI
jgi:hypothetical protein